MTPSTSQIMRNGKKLTQNIEMSCGTRSAVYTITDEADCGYYPVPNYGDSKLQYENENSRQANKLDSIGGYPVSGLPDVGHISGSRQEAVDYRSHSDDPLEDPKRSEKPLDEDHNKQSSGTHKRCLLGFLLVVGFLLLAGTATAVTLYFLGEFYFLLRRLIIHFNTRTFRVSNKQERD
ncbi:hypothetical protein LSH36_45g14124 [Paralvinella palmiformis]|uniref:Uncharacterized protein n=1 Tax=Paralvinella palmiformis TaxID=53620 RepID=A0AAD9K7F0_9ANNE|nr:hypothetical protein LSH36_45g14124 [Paralvinella palmiformis]